jgi:GNAT superfamily N-acetyltransferase
MRVGNESGRAGMEIRSGYLPGAIGRIVELHGAYYASHWGFGAFFEARMARELAEFVDRFDPKRDGLWTAAVAGRIGGAIAIDGSRAGDGGAHLRWFILDPGLHGRGTGRRLLEEALGFCRRCGHRHVSLWTFSGLDAARRLYEQAGFRLSVERRGAQWGIEVTEQRFELDLTDR